LLQHERYQINAVTKLSNSMLDLEPSVHLQEEEIPGIVIDEKLDRAS
jgi:hypothetical protein